jgi:hypothetical protein
MAPNDQSEPRPAKTLQGIDDPAAVAKIVGEFMFLMGRSSVRMP